MAVNNKTYQPIQALTIQAGEDLEPFRFVSHLGTLCATESKSLGVTEQNWLKDEHASVITQGTVPIETSGAISIGDNVTSDADGKAKTATTTMEVNGRALDGTTEAGFIKILLVP